MNAEIQYETPSGMVHSDLDGEVNDSGWRAAMHAALDEFLNRSARGAADGFYVGQCVLRSDLD